MLIETERLLLREYILEEYYVLEAAYEKDCKLLIAGNGGSAADAEHIAGELPAYSFYQKLGFKELEGHASLVKRFD